MNAPMAFPAAVTVERIDPMDRDAAAQVDTFILADPDSSPFQRPAWVRAVAAATGNRAHMIVARDGQGAIAGSVALNHVRSMLFGNALVSAGFAIDGGIAARDPATGQALADAVWALARELGCPTAELRGGLAPQQGWRVVEGHHLNFVRPLAADSEAELARSPRKHRAEIRKALGNADLRAVHGRSDALLDQHYGIYAQSVRNLGTPVFPRSLFREMLAAFGEDADITVIYDRDRPVSAVFSLYHHDVVMPYWGGGIADARRLRSNELLYFSLMDHARARGCTHFDFGRSKVGSGQAAWKKSWGFEGTLLTYHVREDGPARDINPESAKYRAQVALWKKLPLPVANLIGPWISRGLG